MNGVPGWDSLSLGFRELFRFLVPGVYAFAVFRYFLRDPSPAWLFDGWGAAAMIFFLGVLVHAPHFHEWLPWYKGEFKRITGHLNDVVAEAAAFEKTSDHQAYKDFYKYFLEAHADAGLRERIHYFSSFYYMLVQLSVLSLLAAFVDVALRVLSPGSEFSHWLRKPGPVFFLLAAYLFRHLGNKQWRAIVEQQVVLVRDCQEKLKILAEKWKPKSSS